jgi:predicted DsbA family dithiol-disulfide isomerase
LKAIRRLTLPSSRLARCTHCPKRTAGRCSVCRKPVCRRCWHISRDFHLAARARQADVRRVTLVWKDYSAKVEDIRRKARREGNRQLFALLH